MAQKDYYKVLGVARTAAPDQVKQAYRALMKQWHPDRNPDNAQEAVRRTSEINEAWAALGDPARRKAYDESLRVGAAGPTKRPAPAAGRPRSGRAAPRQPTVGFSPGGLQDILSGMHRQGRANVRADAAAARASQGSSSKTGEYELPLTTAEAQQGGIKTLNIDGTSVRIAIPPGQTDGKTLPLILRVRVGR